jgi:type III pantothenate kinase
MWPEQALVLDAGNSRIKIGHFVGAELQQVWAVGLGEWQGLSLPRVNRAVLCSVSVPEAALEQWLKDVGVGNVQVFDSRVPLPFETDYRQAVTLGSDRKMLVMGANRLFPGRNCLIVSLGSCITYDLVDACGKHLGGDISPGLHMRWEAMHHFTARLPKVSVPDAWMAYGTDTESALQSGALQGVLAELKGRIAQMELILNDLTIILCGGDAHFFEKRIDSRIFAEPNLALYGLHALLNK